MLSVGVQTAPLELSQEQGQPDAMDTVSEDMFPLSPEKIVKSGGEIVQRRSNNSSVLSDGIMDAVTVVLSQLPTKALPAVSRSPSESLLSRTPKSAEAKAETLVAELADRSDSEDEFGGPVKSRKRSRQLSSSDSESGNRRAAVAGRKRRKKTPSPNTKKALRPVHTEIPLDQTLESPHRLVENIKAKFAVGMLARAEDASQRRSSPRASPKARRGQARMDDIQRRASPRTPKGRTRPSKNTLDQVNTFF